MTHKKINPANSHKQLPKSNNSNLNSLTGTVIKNKSSLKNRPKKSPIPIRDCNRNKQYLSQNKLNIYSTNNNNSVRNAIQKRFATNLVPSRSGYEKPVLNNYNHTTTHKALSPLKRTKFNAPKLSPHISKQKYKSKSPILSQSMSGYKKIKTNYLGNNNHTRSNSNSNRPSLNKTNKKDLISNRPKSSMSSIKRPKVSPNTTNRSNDISQTPNESNVNHSLNVQSNKSQSDDNVMNDNDNESDMNINEKINVNTPKQEMSIEQQQHQQIKQKFKASIKGIY